MPPVSKKQRMTAITQLAKEFALPMNTVRLLTDRYADLIIGRTETGMESYMDIPSGILSLDSFAAIKPGITLIYGSDSSGKTSLAKRIAKSATMRDLTVLYADTDHKLANHDKEYLRGCYMTGATEAAAVHKIFSHRLIDVLVVDTITAMLPKTQQYLIHHARKCVPYIIIVSQMRYDMEKNVMVPAVWDTVAALAHTHIHLTNHEQIYLDDVDVTRVYAAVSKTQDSFLRNTSTAWIVKDHIIDNILTALDMLSCSGHISSIGPVKYVHGEEIGDVATIRKTPDMAQLVVQSAWETISSKEGDYELFGVHGLHSTSSESNPGTAL